jgi:hypothetical protein
MYRYKERLESCEGVYKEDEAIFQLINQQF